ncbi:alpha-galactosidase [Streptomyces sp. NBC_00887]
MLVLDDGWSAGAATRQGSATGRSTRPWPDGLRPLVKDVRSLGMQVGLWVEPERVNPHSDLARAHPTGC